jgi:transposase
MARYIPYDPKQSPLLVINYEDQLQPGTFEHALHYLIEQRLDLSVFEPRYCNDETGRPAIAPAILLKIVLFAYSKGITSSRQMQWCCATNIIFKALSCDSVPHFITIARFVSAHHDEVSALFEQVLLVCDEQGLLGHELFVIDSYKMGSNAAKEWSGTFAELAKKRDKIARQVRHHMEVHCRVDESEAADRAQQQRSAQAIDTLAKAYDKIDRFLAEHEPRMGKGKRVKEVKSNVTDNESAKMTTSKGTIQGYNGVAAVDKKHQIVVDAQAFGDGQEHHTLQPVLEAIEARYQRLNLNKDIFDTGAVVTADTGFANEDNMRYVHEHGINAYIPDNQFRSRDPKFAEQKSTYGKRHQGERNPKARLFEADAFTFDPMNNTCVCPAGNTLRFKHQGRDAQDNLVAYFIGRLSQCRGCALKHECMRNPEATDHRKGHGRQVCFVLDKRRKPTYTDWMKRRVDSVEGKLIYSHRMSVVEPLFGILSSNKRLTRFSLRSRDKVQSQWRLYCLVHNIEKLANYGALAA